mmetsp:Transcript_6061/g.22913  ORF Transcript_6061/g.22913 Transcript_6061/m.22913 type:complete len:273 (-) Transcript_6061:3637-4455(-)
MYLIWEILLEQYCRPMCMPDTAVNVVSILSTFVVLTNTELPQRLKPSRRVSPRNKSVTSITRSMPLSTNGSTLNSITLGELPLRNRPRLHSTSLKRFRRMTCSMSTKQSNSFVIHASVSLPIVLYTELAHIANMMMHVEISATSVENCWKSLHNSSSHDVPFATLSHVSKSRPTCTSSCLRFSLTSHSGSRRAAQRESGPMWPPPSQRVGSKKGSWIDASPAISNGEPRYRMRNLRTRYSMCGSTHQLATFPSLPTTLRNGSNGGRIRMMWN